MSLQNQRQVTVWIESDPAWDPNGVLGDLGIFEARTGGNLGSENTDFAPGAMAPRKQIGGQQTAEDITVNRVFIRERDRALVGALAAARGRARMSTSDTLLDRSKNPFGDPVTFTGIMGEYHHPDADSESNDPARLEIVMNTDAELIA